MKWTLRTAAVLWLMLLAGEGGAGAAAGKPEAVDGVLGLESYSFERDGELSLSGEWELYWQALLEPGVFADAVPAGYARVPGTWNEQKLDGVDLSDSYATGAVHGPLYVGRLVGYNDGQSIQTSYATGEVDETPDNDGLIGNYLAGAISASYYNDSNAQAQPTGTFGRSLAELGQADTYDGWLFGSGRRLVYRPGEFVPSIMQTNPRFLYNTLEVIRGITDYERMCNRVRKQDSFAIIRITVTTNGGIVLCNGRMSRIITRPSGC